MALVEIDMTGAKIDKIERAIKRLRAFEPPEGYHVAFSGGKDSQCVYHLCQQAGVKFDAHYSVTGVDPPEVVRFIKQQYPDVSRDIPHDKNGKPITMWNLIVRMKMPPLRNARYCCAELKENAGAERVVVTGVRWAESARRKAKQGVVNVFDGDVLNTDNDESRRYVEQCYRTRKTLANPIIDWTDADVWEYLDEVVKVTHCELYDQGFKRIGCIGCPMGGPRQMQRQFERWPKYYGNYLRTFERMLSARGAENCTRAFTSAQSVMDWWLGKRNKVSIEGQIEFDFDGGEGT